MEYTKKLIYQSNYWYNDGLSKARIYDTSGAIASLKKSLQYCRENIDARNLLGLLYYGRGEVAEALVEWIISKNLKSHENIAEYFIQKIQESPNELEAMNNAIKKYNQCLNYCAQNGEDLALIQLKKITASHPTFLKAQLLTALLYMQTEQYGKARQTLKKAHKLDTTNEITLRYMHELSKLNSKKLAKIREDKEETVTYKVGNETIIQPAAAGVKDNGPFATILNMLIGLLVGAAAVFFLVVPSNNAAQTEKFNREVVKYSDQIAAKNAEVSALQKDLEGYRSNSDQAEAAKATAESTKESYEALLQLDSHWRSKDYTNEALAKEMLEINKDSLGEGAKELYDDIYKSVIPKMCSSRYKAAMNGFEVGNYDASIRALELVTAFEEGYKDGNALFVLAQSYDKTGDAEKAKTTYTKVIELYPDSDMAKEAKDAIK